MELDIDKYIDLVRVLRGHDYRYHVLNEPTIPDDQYDHMRNTAIALETLHPVEVRKVNTKLIVDTVGFDPQIGMFDHVQHSHPMLSLGNQFTAAEVLAWIQKLPLPLQLVNEVKLDGLSLSLIYLNRRLYKAITRGSGLIGEDVTAQVQHIKGIPLKLTGHPDILSLDQVVTIRGEVVVSHANFELINKRQTENGKKLYVNPRNLAAGSMRIQDPEELAKRMLEFKAYSFHTNVTVFETHSDAMTMLDLLGFDTADGITLEENTVWDLATVEALNKDFLLERVNYPYAIDGRVWKVDSLVIQQEMGNRTASPRWGTSYKFPADEKVTKLLSVTFQVGRTGAITPVANIAPVFVGGVTVSNVTLHNVDELNRLDLRYNDFVNVKRAGDVIPKITHVVLDERTEPLQPIQLPTHCPSCNSLLILSRILDGAIEFNCDNELCRGRQGRLLEYQTGRDVFNIMGFGPATAERVLNKSVATTIWDILGWDREALAEVEPSEALQAKLWNEIQGARKQSLTRILTAFGIDKLADGKADKIARNIGTLDMLWQITPAALLMIPDIGPKLVANLIKWRDENPALLSIIKRVMLEIDNPPPLVESNLLGKSIVVTGSNFADLKRKQVEAFYQARGCKIAKDISKNTHLVMCGTSYTAHKLAAAIENKVSYRVFDAKGLTESYTNPKVGEIDAPDYDA